MADIDSRGSSSTAEHLLREEERQFHDEVLKCLDTLSGKIEECRTGAEKSGKEKLFTMMVSLRSRVENIAGSIASEIERKYSLNPVKENDMTRIGEIDDRIKKIIEECGTALGGFTCASVEGLSEFNENVNAHMREFDKLYGERSKILRLYRVYG